MRLGDQRRIRAAVSDLDRYAPTPWIIDGLVANLAAARGRRIMLIPWTFPPGRDSPSGQWIPTARTDAIFYAADSTRRRRDGIISHEVGHIVLRHTPRLAEASDELLKMLFPSLPPVVARRVLVLARARTGYDIGEEADAEDFGTRLIERATHRRPPPRDDELGRLTDIL